MSDITPEESVQDPEVVAHTAEGPEEEDPVSVTCIGYYSPNEAV